MRQIVFWTIILLLITQTTNGQNVVKRYYKLFSDTTFKRNDIILAPEIHFALSSCCFLREFKDSIMVIANFMKKHPTFVIEVGAFTDSRGKKESNVTLTLCRATCIVDFLTKEILLPTEKVVPKGYGSADLVASDAEIKKIDNRTEEGRSDREKLHCKNRRVEIKILLTE